MIFIVFQLLFISAQTKEVKFKSFDVEKRKIKLNLVDYCYDKITEVYIQEKNNKNTPIEKVELDDEEYPSILVVEIPESVTTDCDILIIAEPQVIKIGSIKFDNNNNLSGSSDLKIICRYSGHTNIFYEMKRKFLEGEDVEEKYGDNNPTVKCYGTSTNIFVDFSRFEKYMNLKESSEIFIKKNSKVDFNIDFPSNDFDSIIEGKRHGNEENLSKIVVSNFKGPKTKDSKCVFIFESLSSRLYSNPFWIRIPTEKYGYITLGSFIYNKEWTIFKGYANKRVRLYLSNDLKKHILSSVTNYKSFNLQSQITNETQSKNNSKVSGKSIKPEKDINSPQNKEKSLVSMILEDCFYQFLSVIAIFFMIFFLVLAIVVLIHIVKCFIFIFYSSRIF